MSILDALIIGVRGPLGCRVKVWRPGLGDRMLPLRLSWRNHSPTGFEWGYGGSGPAQLALAILGLILKKERALELYQGFKWEVLTKLPHESWELPVRDVADWVDKQNPEKQL